jgi:hypothetical protein
MDRGLTLSRAGLPWMPIYGQPSTPVHRRKVNLSGAFAGQNVGIKEVAEKIWLVTFMHYDLGFFDDQCNRVECAPNPFSAKVSAMSAV